MINETIYDEYVTFTDQFSFSFTNLPFKPRVIMICLHNSITSTPSQNQVANLFAERGVSGYFCAAKITGYGQPIVGMSINSSNSSYGGELDWGENSVSINRIQYNSYGDVRLSLVYKYHVIILP